MSFLKISDPAKRDLIVKEYLELKKNIRDNLLSEKTGEKQLQTDLSKFYRPITETQIATMKEITEGLRPIREGIEKLPQAIQPIGEEDEEEEDESIGEIAKYFLNKPNTDKIFGVRKIGADHYIGNKHVIIKDDDIIIKENGERFVGTRGLWELITLKNPDKSDYDKMDKEDYERLMIKTNAVHKKYDPKNPHPRSNRGDKWTELLSPMWEKYNKKGYLGEGVVVIPSDPNALLKRLDLLLASQKVGHTGVGNELVSICDELKRQGVLDTNAYGGSGVFDTIANLLARIFTSSAAKQIASSALVVGKSVAKEGAKKALDVGKSAAVDVGKKLVTKALTPKSKKILQKYTQSTTQPTTQDINTLIDGSAIEIQDLVKKLNSGV